VKKCVAKDHSAQLFGIADPFSDPPFGLVHRLSALALNKFKFCNVGRWSIASRNRSLTAPLFCQLDFLPQSLAHWNIRRAHSHSATRLMFKKDISNSAI
ncbi:hypothetical protein H5410_061383, partial [Solanum commersonii]